MKYLTFLILTVLISLNAEEICPGGKKGKIAVVWKHIRGKPRMDYPLYEPFGELSSISTEYEPNGEKRGSLELEISTPIDGKFGGGIWKFEESKDFSSALYLLFEAHSNVPKVRCVFNAFPIEELAFPIEKSIFVSSGCVDLKNEEWQKFKIDLSNIKKYLGKVKNLLSVTVFVDGQTEPIKIYINNVKVVGHINDQEKYTKEETVTEEELRQYQESHDTAFEAHETGRVLKEKNDVYLALDYFQKATNESEDNWYDYSLASYWRIQRGNFAKSLDCYRDARGSSNIAPESFPLRWRKQVATLYENDGLVAGVLEDVSFGGKGGVFRSINAPETRWLLWEAQEYGITDKQAQKNLLRRQVESKNWQGIIVRLPSGFFINYEHENSRISNVFVDESDLTFHDLELETHEISVGTTFSSGEFDFFFELGYRRRLYTEKEEADQLERHNALLTKFSVGHFWWPMKSSLKFYLEYAGIHPSNDSDITVSMTLENLLLVEEFYRLKLAPRPPQLDLIYKDEFRKFSSETYRILDYGVVLKLPSIFDLTCGFGRDLELQGAIIAKVVHSRKHHLVDNRTLSYRLGLIWRFIDENEELSPATLSFVEIRHLQVFLEGWKDDVLEGPSLFGNYQIKCGANTKLTFYSKNTPLATLRFSLEYTYLKYPSFDLDKDKEKEFQHLFSVSVEI